MRKIVFLILTAGFLGGCSVLKDKSSRNDTFNGLELKTKGVIDFKKDNISEKGFFIQKAAIEFFSQSGTEYFLCSIKFEKAGKYLVSLRSTTGVEGARFFISEDTVLINDRINKNLLYGDPDYLRSKFGVSMDAIPLLFGDIVGNLDEKNTAEPCLNDSLKISSSIRGNKFNYVIDCNNGKSINAEIENSTNSGRIKFDYSRFKNFGSISLPRSITCSDVSRKMVIKISIEKVEFPWNGSLDFIPGDKYEKIFLR